MHREVSFKRTGRRKNPQRSYIDRVKRRSENYLGNNLRQAALITVIPQGANKLLFKLDRLWRETRDRAVELLHNLARVLGGRFCPVTHEMTVAIPR